MAALDGLGNDDLDWNYRGSLMLAPMVRINHLPFRMLAAEYGAGMVYSEEVCAGNPIPCPSPITPPHPL